MEKLIATTKDSSNTKFVYAHVFLPHAPFVVDSLARPIKFFQQPRSLGNPQAYVDQVKGTNLLLEPVIDRIIAAAPTAIVIVTGDHGYRYLKDGGDEPYSVFLAARGLDIFDSSGPVNANQIFKKVFERLQK